jgi:hypothetical protein
MSPRVATNLTRYPRVSEYATGITGYVLPPSPSELLQRQNLVSVIRFGLREAALPGFSERY